MVASTFLFVGMGINYRLLDKEAKKKDEESDIKEKEEESTIDTANKATSNEPAVARQKNEIF